MENHTTAGIAGNPDAAVRGRRFRTVRNRQGPRDTGMVAVSRPITYLRIYDVRVANDGRAFGCGGGGGDGATGRSAVHNRDPVSATATALGRRTVSTTAGRGHGTCERNADVHNNGTIEITTTANGKNDRIFFFTYEITNKTLERRGKLEERVGLSVTDSKLGRRDDDRSTCVRANPERAVGWAGGRPGTR